MPTARRRQLDLAAGLLSFDDSLETFSPRRLSILWIENALDCRMWAYYCDIRTAMEKLHHLCTPRGAQMCFGGRNKFVPDVAIIGPRYSINVASDDEGVGFDRRQHPTLPLLILQNKMYTPVGWKEIVGNRSAKLEWARKTGASAAFTWLTRHREFTKASGVPHHWMPFGVNQHLFGANAGNFARSAQPYDVGFTGASGKDKYPQRAALLEALRSMNLSSYFGEWSQTALNRADKRSWKAGTTAEYSAQLARTRIWLSTLGPSNIVGTRYFEVLASGTTLLMCNSPPPGTWVYDGLFQDGVHVVMFHNLDDMKVKVLKYLADEPARQRIVRNAHELTHRIHTWEARARFISRVAELAIERVKEAPTQAPRYVPFQDSFPANHSSFLGCFIRSDKKEDGLVEPPRSRNKRRLYRYTVASCIEACRSRRRRPTVAALSGGGFATGNGHAHARCMCAATSPPRASDTYNLSTPSVKATSGQVTAPMAIPPGWKRRPNVDCATTCSLRDSRPCGGQRAHAFFNLVK